MSALGRERIESSRKRLAGKSPADRRQLLRDDWSKLLGPVTPARPPIVQSQAVDDQPASGARVERIVLEVEPGIVVPLVVLAPARLAGRAPVVIGLAQTGKAGFLKERAGELRKLVGAGTTVVLPDVRGTGETRSGDTDLSVNLQLFGETLLGERVRDLRSVLLYLRQRKDIDPGRVALWGDAFAPLNGADTNFKVPRNVEGWPRGSEPLGGLLALFGALFDEDIRAVYLAGGLAGYHGVLTHFAVLIPHSASVPGALLAGDLCDVAGALAPRPLRLEAMVDHLNRPVSAAAMKSEYAATVQSYLTRPEAFSFGTRRSSPAAWLLEQLR